MTDAASQDAVGRSALRKATWRLLPLIGLGYGIAYMDRVNIGFAALQMNEDLGFSAAVYGLGGGLFFLTYAALEVPSNLLLVRFGARRWIARIMLTWGVLAIGMMFVRTPTQFYGMRLLLGAAEAGFFPGILYYVTQWFPTEHRGRAISRFYVAIPLSSVVMGGLAGALLSLDGKLGLHGWQWLFLIEGLPAVLLSVVVLFALPDSPAAARWLTDPERNWITGRLAADKAALAHEAEPRLGQVLTDPRVICLGLASLCVMFGNYAFNLSAPAILRAGTGLDVYWVGYLVAGGGLVGAVAMIGNAWSSDRRRERTWHAATSLIVSAAALVVIAMSPTPLAVAVGYLAWVAASMALQPVFWSIPTDMLHGRTAAIGVAAIGAISMTGAFAGPYAWGLLADSTGGFQTGLYMLVAPALMAAGLILLAVRIAAARRARPPPVE